MARIAVFAGLGSELLFSSQTSNAAIEDASLPEAKIILSVCHAVFRSQLTKASQEGHLDPDAIDLDDFSYPESLLQPAATYHGNVVIQHVVLYLVQVLRYVGYHGGRPDIHAVSGFCAGLLPAAAVASANSMIEFLQYAQDFFYVALWLGIKSEAYRRSQMSGCNLSSSAPWSVVVHNVCSDMATDIENSSVYISARNSASCVTLSGRGDELAQFIQEKMPSQSRTRTTNVLTLYHNRHRLTPIFQQTVDALRVQLSHRFEVSITSACSLFSTINGIDIASSDEPATLGQLITSVLEMILLEPVDWIQVQASIISALHQTAESTECEILNFGPGYGMSRSAQPLPNNVTIRDTSANGIRRAPTSTAPSISLDDVAIVGMAVELPDAQDTDELWHNLSNGVSSCQEIPSSRFHIDDFFKKDENRHRAGRSMITRYGNFMRNPFLFDNDLFDISPREARSMDPQQRVLLQTGYRALEDAGYVPDSSPSFARRTFGCFIGNATLDYTDNLRGDIDVYYSTGTLRAFQSGRLSYYFGWSGPSMTLDTACSSSTVALHQAVRALANGDCRAALVGGVNVISSPDMYLGLNRAHFLSPSGQCKAFDASADGYCRAEGCAVFVVKTVRDAIAEGDRIHAIIRGIEVNQSGNAHSITHPHAPTQEWLFQRLFERTKVNPHDITLVEAHGTGTQAGDPNEVESLRRVLCTGRDPRCQVHFTSIKANIGHTEAASGAAALAKVVLMMKNGRIPPQISLKTLNPKIQALKIDGVVIDRNEVSWHQPGGQPRLALINNFGAAGSNAAMILQEFNQSSSQPTRDGGQAHFLGLSGKSKKVVLKLREQLIASLSKPTQKDSPSLADICYTMTSRRQLYDFRLSVTAESIPQLIRNLASAEPSKVSLDKDTTPQIVFVFSGQGSQYLGMGQQLMSIYPSFSKTIQECDRLLKENGFPGCLGVIDAQGARNSDAESVLEFQAFQSAIFSLEVALAQLLMSWNTLPTVVTGHSLGEYAALVVAGVMDISSGLLLTARRAQLMMSKCELEKTSMLAVNIGISEAQTVIGEDDRFRQLSIACDNSRTDCIIGGPIPQLQVLKEHLTSTRKVKSKLLDVPLAYHTTAMDPILSSLKKYASTVVLKKPLIPVISNVLGRRVQPGEDVFTPDYFVRHSGQAVNFRQGLEDFMSAGPSSKDALWIEIGPHPSLLPMVATDAPATQANLFPCLRKAVPPSSSISQLLRHLYQRGMSVDWRKIFAFREPPRVVSLPGLPFFQSEFVAAYPHETLNQFTEDSGGAQANDSGSVFPGRVVQRLRAPNQIFGIYETSIQSLKDFIAGHIVCGYALCPASVYHQIALAAIEDLEPDSDADYIWSLGDLSYITPLLYDSQSTAVIRIQISPDGGDSKELRFEISSSTKKSGTTRDKMHCKGRLKQKCRKSITRKHTQVVRKVENQMHRLLHPGENVILETFSTRAMYESTFTRVVKYSELYRQVQFIRITPDCREAYAKCSHPGVASTPAETGAVFMDVLLHVAGFVANLRVSNEEACICKEVASCLVLRRPTSSKAQFNVCCTTTALPEEGSVIADAEATDENGVLAVFKGMLFQRVSLARLSQSFSMASKRDQRSMNTPKACISTQNEGSALKTVYTNVKAAPLKSSSSNLNVRSLIAETGGIDSAAIFAETKLETLGFDSLLMIELAAHISENFPRTVTSEVAECITVGDVERLCHETQSLSTSSTASISPLEEEAPVDECADMQKLVREVIADTCGGDISDLDSGSDLASLGIDSLMMFELENSLFNLDKKGKLSSVGLLECRTVGDIENLIIVDNKQRKVQVRKISPTSKSSSSSSSTAVSPSTTPSWPVIPQMCLSLNTLQKVSNLLKLDQQPERVKEALGSSYTKGEDRAPPLFLIHDGSGICTHYHRIRHLPGPIYALHNPKFLEPFDAWTSVEEMAHAYAREITSTATGPYMLGGWSFGGVVAFEAARRLMAQGYDVVGTILIDSPPPVNHQPLSPHIIDTMLTQGKQPSNESSGAIRSLIRANFAACVRLLGDFHPEPPGKLPVPRAFLLRSNQGWRDPSSPHSVENEWLQDRSDPKNAVAGWEAVTASEVSCIDIPGNHFQVFDPDNINAVSDAIRRASAELEASYAEEKLVN
ncbi:putative polyketide synthase [Xylariales sp. AK1849]|nr:putative polyketide synthase [Xylariales sp. AK1849]